MDTESLKEEIKSYNAWEKMAKAQGKWRVERFYRNEKERLTKQLQKLISKR